MSFDRDRLSSLIAAHGPVARVVVASVAGSAPREVGAAMTVWVDGQDGTIGGGALELSAAEHARAALRGGGDRFDRVPLGPAVAQCCGGNVGLLTEVWTKARLAANTSDVIARPLPGTPGEMPLSVRRILQAGRGQGARPGATVLDGWMIEPLLRPDRQLWLYGAGHVGRAIVPALAPLPDIAITWVDTALERFPQNTPTNVATLVAKNPADAVRHAPADAEHLVLTYSHAYDLEICHRLLAHGFGRAGLIGSATKWARFRKRLAALGHGEHQIARIACPIGDPELGKHPQAIAIGVAAAFVRAGCKKHTRAEDVG